MPSLFEHRHVPTCLVTAFVLHERKLHPTHGFTCQCLKYIKISLMNSQISSSTAPSNSVDMAVEFSTRTAAQKLGRVRSRQLFDILWKSKSIEWAEAMCTWGQADLAARL